MGLNRKGTHVGCFKESGLVRSEDNHALSGSTSASCTAKAVDILLAGRGKANLHDQCYSTNDTIQLEVNTGVNATNPGKSMPRAVTSDVTNIPPFALLKS